jgi:hypothetical protein
MMHSSGSFLILSNLIVLSKLLGFFIAPFDTRAEPFGGHCQLTEEARSNNQLQQDKTTIFWRLCMCLESGIWLFS